MRTYIRKRSSCASGSGNVPSCSIGFCVAITRNSGGSAIGVAADRDLALAHRFQQRRLHLGRRAVDLVGEQQRMEDRAGLEFEAAVLRAPDLGAGQVGRQQVGRELDAGEIGLQPRGQRADRAGLGQAGRAFDQQVAVGQQRDQQALDQRRLPDDLGRQRGAQRAEGIVQAGDCVAAAGAGSGVLLSIGLSDSWCRPILTEERPREFAGVARRSAWRQLRRAAQKRNGGLTAPVLAA